MGLVKLVAILFLAVVAIPAAAGASTTISPDSGASYPYQRWIDAARVPTPDVEVTVIEQPCPDLPDERACTYSDGRIYFPPPVPLPMRSFYHELGHQFDYNILTDDARRRFLDIRNDSREWHSPPNSPHEQFAEGYSLCAAQRRPHRPDREGFYYWQGIGKHRAACRLIRSVGAPVV